MTVTDRDALVAEAVPIALGLARRFAGGSVPSDETRAEALYGVAVALARWDAARSPWRPFVRLVVRQRVAYFARRWARRPPAGATPAARADPRARDPSELAAAAEGCELVRARLDRRAFRLLWNLYALGRTRTEAGRRAGCSRQRIAVLERRALDAARGD